jgi:hypothetical protein
MTEQPTLEFQKLNAASIDKSLRIFRTPIPGGWLVVTYRTQVSVTFVPDENHIWDGSSLPSK